MITVNIVTPFLLHFDMESSAAAVNVVQGSHCLG